MDRKTRIAVILWDSHIPILERIAPDMDEDLEIIRAPSERNDAQMNDIVERIQSADAAVIYMHGTDFCDDMERRLSEIKDSMKIISFGNDPSKWGLTSIDHEVAVRTFEYMMKGGDENLRRMFDFIAKSLLGKKGDVLPPVDVPWQGIISLDDDIIYDSPDEYIDGNNLDRTKPFVGIIGSRPAYLMDGLKVEKDLATRLREIGVNPILVFVAFSKKPEFGALSHTDVIMKYFCEDGKTLVGAIVKFSTGFLEDGRGSDYGTSDPESLNIISRANVPIFQPVVMSRMSEEEWRQSAGLTTDITWQVAFPEFEGVIDPFVIGSDIGCTSDGDKERTTIPERSTMIAEMVRNYAMLGRKPNGEKKVVIFLNNFPCYGVEANVGNAAGLDSLESISDLLKKMKEDGYYVNPPDDGRDLIRRILDSKALSEFRWTTPQEMKKCGGVFHEMDIDEYMGYFDSLSDKVQNDIISTWGEPPGQGMVLDGNILITGISFGNVVVAVQPKRGCFGSKCDGQVCKILHDPACPPTHQFIATYHYYEKIWGADMVIHTGTHGSMEWTPGKGVGMTESCYPDVCMNSTPHLYIYNSDNPSEGLVAKRRSYATLIDHMQNLMVGMNLYGPFTELDNLLSEYPIAKNDPTHAKELKSAIISKAAEAKLDDIGLSPSMPLDECVRLCHETLSRMRNSQINKGLHILGRMPQGED
ncbi:MAG: cobaltochelatase subunit CobN, partial [Candidatus Methanomethylophilaceae archaeon]